MDILVLGLKRHLGRRGLLEPQGLTSKRVTVVKELTRTPPPKPVGTLGFPRT